MIIRGKEYDEIEIYEDKNGNLPVADFLEALNVKARTSKEHRVRLKKISEYLQILKAYGSKFTLIEHKSVKYYNDFTIWS